MGMLNVILAENIRMESTDKEESEAAKSKKINYLLKQSTSLQKWIDQFQDCDNESIKKYVKGAHNLRSLSVIPKGLNDLKNMADGEIDNINPCLTSKLKSQSKISSPRGLSNKKNNRLFISSITPNINGSCKTYFGSKAISNKFSIKEDDAYCPKILRRDFMNKSESGPSMYATKKQMVINDISKSSYQNIKRIIKKKTKMNLSLSKTYSSNGRDASAHLKE